jgi:hypothetical protein
MPETETVMINGSPVIIEKVITSGDLILSSMLTVLISLILALIVLHFIGGRR